MLHRDAGAPASPATGERRHRRGKGPMSPVQRGFWLSLGGWMGIAVQVRQPAVADATLAAGTLLAGFLAAGALLTAAFRARGDRAGRRRIGGRMGAGSLVIALLLAGGLLGWAATDLRAAARLAERIDPALEGQDLEVEGLVSGLPVLRPEGLRFRFEVHSARHRGQAVPVPQACPQEVSLGWYRQPQEADDAAANSGAWPRAGERWRFTVRLRRPHGTLNPQGFDLELWMFEQRLRATGHVRERSGRPPLRLSQAQGAWIEVARERWRAAIFERVGPSTAAGVLAALAVGDQASIEVADWAVFRRSGVAHLMSISGLHVTLFAWLAARLLGWAWRRSAAACLRWPAPQVGRWGGLVCAVAYALLAGWGVPAQRTVMMLAVVTLLRGMALRWRALAVLWVAGSVVLAWDPWAMLQPGFWLSFVAVGLLMGADGAGPPVRPTGGPAGLQPVPEPSVVWRRLAASLAEGWRSQWVVSVGLAPWTLLFFQQLSLVGLLANAVAIPLVTLWITPLALLGTLVPVLWSVAALSVDGLMVLLRWLADLSWAVWEVAQAPVWAQVAALLGAALTVAPLPGRLRTLGAAMLMPMLLARAPAPAEGEFELLALDVGQGSSVLVRTRQHSLLFDAGPSYGAGRDAGDRVVVPLLRAQGVQRLDVLALSHRDSDHVGGAESVMRQIGAHRVISTLEVGHPLRTAAVHQPCAAGLSWQWDGVVFEWLHPAAGADPSDATASRSSHRPRRSNARSCVLRLQAHSRSALLTADVEREQELTLLDQHQARQLSLKADVLVVPHHGSRTSSTAAFLAAVAPTDAVMQVGWRNRYGHPAQEVVDRYHGLGIRLWRTDRCGAWVWRSQDASFGCERQLHARYWHAPAWGEGVDGGPEIAKHTSNNPPIP
jgi:competence protein ComEC